MNVEERCRLMSRQAEETESYTQTCIAGEKVFFVEHDHAIMPGHIYSNDGIKEYKISQACEYHFDTWLAEDEGEFDGNLSQDSDLTSSS